MIRTMSLQLKEPPHTYVGAQTTADNVHVLHSFHLCCIKLNLRMYAYTYVCMHVCMQVRMYACTYVCMHVHKYVCMHIRMYVCMHVRMYACTYICMHVMGGRYECTYIRTYVQL